MSFARDLIPEVSLGENQSLGLTAPAAISAHFKPMHLVTAPCATTVVIAAVAWNRCSRQLSSQDLSSAPRDLPVPSSYPQ